jgi:hypothetical protein
MPKYIPIDCGVPMQAGRSNLASLQWSINGIVAEFFLPDDESRLLRVSFDRQCIIRVLDEMPLSTEEDDTPAEGLVPEHFAYRLEGATFAAIQSDAWKAFIGPVAHYRLITGSTCMDVLSAATPVFSLVASSTEISECNSPNHRC